MENQFEQEFRETSNTGRDAMHRCKVCKILYRDDECTLDPVRGLVCPRGCEEPFEQPPYESPINSSDI